MNEKQLNYGPPDTGTSEMMAAPMTQGKVTSEELAFLCVFLFGKFGSTSTEYLIMVTFCGPERKRKMNIWEKEINEYEDNKLYIGQRIQESRLAKKMRGADLGAYLGISANQVSRIERGEANCDVAKLFVICQCLEMSADYILFGEQKEKNEITDKQRVAIDNLIRAFG